MEVGTKEGRQAPWSSVSEVGDMCPTDTLSLGPQKPYLRVSSHKADTFSAIPEQDPIHYQPKN